ncbi:hypothetical protein Asppvi_005970 [Aspergillus pseudoviridinutans]|uniref:Uncharacterized protein n=1 Tax=Aspergillus pseudoviridinutans TaxID=1517512 RepID=A0A9P3EVH8_9EURO|nr:uncharacterized protein Asppvi_005970 [Aspergillus pseudoviridinutans]GIJ87068.1 hypothetical protein Asppvi_005970 [Aspergillus pseudoviridinutans]
MERLSGLEECLQHNKASLESPSTLLNDAGTESDPRTTTAPIEAHGKSLPAPIDTEKPKRTMDIAPPNVSALRNQSIILDTARTKLDPVFMEKL